MFVAAVPGISGKAGAVGWSDGFLKDVSNNRIEIGLPEAGGCPGESGRGVVMGGLGALTPKNCMAWDDDTKTTWGDEKIEERVIPFWLFYETR